MSSLEVYSLFLNILFSNIDFWSALSGFIGTVVIFFFGLSPMINTGGHINLSLEQIDEKMAKKAKFYKKLSYGGILLLSLSFFLQLVKLF